MSRKLRRFGALMVLSSAGLVVGNMVAVQPLAHATSAESTLKFPQAPVIVTATAGASTSFWSSSARQIYTTTHFIVRNVERGSAPSEITVTFPGGRLASGLGQASTGQISFVAGESDRLYLKTPDGPGAFRLFNGFAGKEQISAPTVAAASAQCPDGGTAGSGYCLMGPKWTTLPVHYRVNTNVPSVSAINAGWAVWESEPGSLMNWTYDGSTSKAATAQDGANVIYSASTTNCDGTNVLACTTSWFQGGSFLEFDTAFTTTFPWSTNGAAGRYDVERVAMHEAGHALGLMHISDSRQIMYPYITAGDTTHVLSGGDVNGVRHLYPGTLPPPPAWSSFESLGGALASGPDVASWGAGRLDTFVVGTTGNVYTQYYDGAWSGFVSLGKPAGVAIVGAPSAVSWGSGRIDLFVTGDDGNLWHRYYSSGWSDWNSLGKPVEGNLLSGPDAASDASGHLDVFARGPLKSLWHKSYTPSGGWSAWDDLGYPQKGLNFGVLAAPGAVSWSAGRIDVFVHGFDDALWHIFSSDDGASWSDWGSLGGVLQGGSGPDASSWAPGRLDVFVRGTEDTLYHKWYSSGWSGWENLGGVLTSDPGAVSWGSGRIDVFVRGNNNAMYHKFYS